jgi:hypothetical protein
MAVPKLSLYMCILRITNSLFFSPLSTATLHSETYTEITNALNYSIHSQEVNVRYTVKGQKQ